MAAHEDATRELNSAFESLRSTRLARALVAANEHEPMETLYDFVDEESVAAVRARVTAALSELEVWACNACDVPHVLLGAQGYGGVLTVSFYFLFILIFGLCM